MSLTKNSGLRLTLRTLLFWVSIFAMGCGALTHPSKTLLLTVVAISLGFFLVEVMTAVFDRGPRRTFAIGFLLCGALHATCFRAIDEEPTKALLEEAYYEFSPAAATTISSLAGRLKHGDEGEAVKALQAALNEHTTPKKTIDVDGDFGWGTRRAVEAFQTQQGLEATGVVSASTWRKLGPVGKRALRAFGLPDFPTNSLTAEYFVQIGGWLATLIIGSIGGYLAVTIHARRQLPAASEEQ